MPYDEYNIIEMSEPPTALSHFKSINFDSVHEVINANSVPVPSMQVYNSTPSESPKSVYNTEFFILLVGHNVDKFVGDKIFGTICIRLAKKLQCINALYALYNDFMNPRVFLDAISEQIGRKLVVREIRDIFNDFETFLLLGDSEIEKITSYISHNDELQRELRLIAMPLPSQQTTKILFGDGCRICIQGAYILVPSKLLDPAIVHDVFSPMVKEMENMNILKRNTSNKFDNKSISLQEVINESGTINKDVAYKLITKYHKRFSTFMISNSDFKKIGDSLIEEEEKEFKRKKQQKQNKKNRRKGKQMKLKQKQEKMKEIQKIKVKAHLNLYLRSAAIWRKYVTKMKLVKSLLRYLQNTGKEKVMFEMEQRRFKKDAVKYFDTVLKCPLSNEIMIHPVVAEDGFTYEYNSICDYVRQFKKSPKTGEKISKKFVRNSSIEQIILMLKQ